MTTTNSRPAFRQADACTIQALTALVHRISGSLSMNVRYTTVFRSRLLLSTKIFANTGGTRLTLPWSSPAASKM